MFCSEPQDGQIFIAERSRKGSRKLFWVSDAKSRRSPPTVGIAGRRVPQSANSIQLTSPGPPAALGSACKMRRPATQAMFQFESSHRGWERTREARASAPDWHVG
jgi:hypothetical protein